ncbi:MAG: sugar ABC transporter permease [Clostridia bacterium]|nr:sugar ABC transporter permease [Clostridia bacterium]
MSANNLTAVTGKKGKSYAAQKRAGLIASYIFLTVLSIIWLLPILWVVLTSFRVEPGSFTAAFFPQPYSWVEGTTKYTQTYTFQNYIDLFTPRDGFDFGKMWVNTLIVAAISCVISTLFAVATAYVMSRMRFKMRKPFMNIALIMGMFPGFMSMIAIYFILKSVGIEKTLLALILVYSGASGLGFQVVKGFFDTVPKALDEAAMIDGANKATVFFKIILPMSKPIIVYQALTAFMGPWMDFIFARFLMGTNYDTYTVAIGLYDMLDKTRIYEYFRQFAAGSVCVAVPIIILFMSLQKYYVEGVTGGAVKG